MTLPADPPIGPHQGQPVLTAGKLLHDAQAAMVLVHGRGASAQDILALVPDLVQPAFAYVAPQAAGNTWYPNRFLAHIASNEPWLSLALAALERTLARVIAAGISLERTLLLGFSQGACLTFEFVARHAQSYSGVAGLSGGLIGPADTPRDYPGSLARIPIFLGSSDVDPHIPQERVYHTGEVLKQLGAAVTLQLYPNMDHAISPAELDIVREMMRGVLMQV